MPPSGSEPSPNPKRMKSRRHWPEATRQRALTMYLKGKRTDEITAALGIPGYTISCWKRKGAGTDGLTWPAYKRAIAERVRATAIQARHASIEEATAKFIEDHTALSSLATDKLRQLIPVAEDGLDANRTMHALNRAYDHGAKTLGLDRDDAPPPAERSEYHLHLHGQAAASQPVPIPVNVEEANRQPAGPSAPASGPQSH